jgi:hypothetical protein
LKKEIQDYFADDFWSMLGLWLDYKEFGLPFGVGYADHPDRYIEFIKTFETAFKNGGGKWQTQ